MEYVENINKLVNNLSSNPNVALLKSNKWLREERTLAKMNFLQPGLLPHILCANQYSHLLVFLLHFSEGSGGRSIH